MLSNCYFTFLFYVVYSIWLKPMLRMKAITIDAVIYCYRIASESTLKNKFEFCSAYLLCTHFLPIFVCTSQCCFAPLCACALPAAGKSNWRKNSVRCKKNKYFLHVHVLASDCNRRRQVVEGQGRLSRVGWVGSVGWQTFVSMHR